MSSTCEEYCKKMKKINDKFFFTPNYDMKGCLKGCKGEIKRKDCEKVIVKPCKPS